MDLTGQQANDLRSKMDLYYQRTEELRDANAKQRDAIFGAVFSYRIEGSDNLVSIWNYRRATPPQMIERGEAPMLHMQTRMAPKSQPSRLPEPGDVIIQDVPRTKFFDRMMGGSWDTWQDAHQAIKDKHGSFYNWTDAAFGRVFVGEIPWELVEVTPALRVVQGWDLHDVAGDPWALVGGSSVSLKTDRTRYVARLEMRERGLACVYIHDGRPDQEGSKLTGDRFYRIPTGEGEPNPEYGEIRAC